MRAAPSILPLLLAALGATTAPLAPAHPLRAQPALAQPALAEPALEEPALAEPALAEPAGRTPSVAPGVGRLRADTTGTVRAIVRDTVGAPVPDATVRLADSPVAGRTEADGTLTLLGVPAGAPTLRITRLGFLPQSLPLVVAGGTTTTVDIVLRPRGEVLGAVATTATLREQFTSESPVRTEVLTQRALQRNVTSNLMDNLNFTVPGVNVQVDCGVCFTNSIRINGMEGPYTAVLVDGAPVMSALAGVYGFNGLHPALIEQVEVIRGPLGTLYGSEAMGGVVNIITKDPRLAPRFALNSFATSDGERTVDAAFTPRLAGRPLLLSATAARNDRFVDRDPDSFTDLPLVERYSLFAKYGDGPAENRRLDLTVRAYLEDRFGGTRDWTRADLGSSEVYGEFIRTERAELIGNWRLPTGGESVRLWFSGTWHDQDAWYGDTPYAATQGTGFGQLVWDHAARGHALQFGGTLRFQHYDDNTPATAVADRSLIAGLFVQDEVEVRDGLTLLGGLRGDWYQRHGVIPAPRLAVKWRPFAHDHTTLRLNAATGFRIVNLFTEDHAALTGARQVRIAEQLRPERSGTVTLGLEQHVHLRGGAEVLVLGLDAFHTRFTNRIQPDYDQDPRLIVYDNLDGTATSRGATLSLQLDAPSTPFTFAGGLTWQDVTLTEAGVTSRVPFAARLLGNLTAGVRVPGTGATVDWTARLVGPMALPEFAGRPVASPWFSEHNVQVTVPVTRTLQCYGAVRNLFDYRQLNAIVGADAPFGDTFDTSYVYGPLQGRRVQLGLRVTGAR
jgi:outer membrane receptor for ferrienterochelin and colicins